MPRDPERAPAIREEVRAHRAARAWRQAGGNRDPHEIRVLWEGGRGRNQIYWLAGAGPDGASVVAKLLQRQRAELEHQIYTEVLPHLPVPRLRYYGSVEDGGSLRWSFVEFAFGERYSPTRADHRRIAGEWLGLVHAAAADVPGLGQLPDRGPDHFLSALRVGRDALVHQLESTETRADAVLVEGVIGVLEAVELRWEDVHETCAAQRSTLVHGDFAPYNLRVRADRVGRPLQVFDWDASGRGPPAVDLTLATDRHFAANPSLDAYRRAFATRTPACGIQPLRRLAAVGKIMRSVTAIEWQSRRFTPSYCGPDKLLAYVEWIREGMREAGWSPHHAGLAKGL
jgi:aminoglycoside phosphotransferase (APT) family kinase protein